MSEDDLITHCDLVLAIEACPVALIRSLERCEFDEPSKVDIRNRGKLLQWMREKLADYDPYMSEERARRRIHRYYEWVRRRQELLNRANRRPLDDNGHLDSIAARLEIVRAGGCQVDGWWCFAPDDGGRYEEQNET